MMGPSDCPGPTNPGIPLDERWIESVRVNLPAVQRRAATLGTKRTVKKQWQAAWMLRAVTCIDLTTLAGDDTQANVQRLCLKAAKPIRSDILAAMDMEQAQLTCGAVCVYPSRVPDAVAALKRFKAPHVPVAAVATGFPSGLYSLETRLREITLAIEAGAHEIDIVLNRQLVLNHRWAELYREVQQMKAACGPKIHMKTILAIGELGSMNNVYKASLVCMMAGADFIKTSTGKEALNANLPVGVVMCRAVRDYFERTGYFVGFKPAGGIRTGKDACTWLILIKEELDDRWLNNKLFRIGASGLLLDLERQLFHYVTGRYAAAHELAMS
eukprot:TCALIF_01021-PA protein Name:"Similar to DERA Putative deoxyribose-phosphate aldolase (Homo sapiens)" AED:0.08 eAED:0.08 QI:0/0/0/1/1/1/3/0/327